jgi:hypothetical protein
MCRAPKVPIESAVSNSPGRLRGSVISKLPARWLQPRRHRCLLAAHLAPARWWAKQVTQLAITSIHYTPVHESKAHVARHPAARRESMRLNRDRVRKQAGVMIRYDLLSHVRGRKALSYRFQTLPACELTSPHHKSLCAQKTIDTLLDRGLYHIGLQCQCFKCTPRMRGSWPKDCRRAASQGISRNERSTQNRVIRICCL